MKTRIFSKKHNLYTNSPSWPSNQRSFSEWAISPDGKIVEIVYFGAKNYEQYKDLLGFYKNLDHGDKNRRMNYRKRHSKILNKEGKPSYTVPFTPAWFSWNILW